ncbi:odorant receptor 46a-like [Xylocopa sonorina]|uniref:odorant receptor 46a-like n=1 Tax=Xylocopa sonorina TaxID=1818115 RepID=UPI00403AF126
MRVSLIFTLLTCTGCWRPISWSSPIKTTIYNAYSLLVIATSAAFVFSAIASIFTVNNMNEFAAITNILIAASVGSCKLTNVLTRRKEIIDLVNMFLQEPCTTSNTDEERIQMKYDDRVRRTTLRYTILIEVSVSITIFNSYLTNFQHGRLTYNSWIPYNYTSEILFPLTFAFQLAPIVVLSLVHGAADALFFGVLTQIYCQFDILLFRLNDVTAISQGTLQKFVRHHNCIYQLAETMNKTLYLTIFSQIFGSSLLLCLSLVQLIRVDMLSTEFFATMCYMLVMTLQSFLYCWYGNEVKLKVCSYNFLECHDFFKLV